MRRSIAVLTLTLTLLTLAAGCRSMTGQSLGTLIDDRTTHASIKSKLAADRFQTLTWVGVDVDNGIVTLTGNTPSDIQKQRAENIARNTPGVRGVVNAILVTPAGVEHAGDVRPPAEAAVQGGAQAGTAQQVVAQQERTVQQQTAQAPRTEPSSRAQMDPAASPATQQVLARQTMNGEVTDVNLGTGQVRLATPEGRVDLNVPQETARTMRAGDRITIEMIVRSAR
jgi:hypothetical protein